jgi:hypothetical protein
MNPHVSLPDPWAPAPAAPSGHAARRLAVFVLHGASAALARAAHHLATPRGATPAATASTVPYVEFHAEAGALEGALYVDGRLVGVLPGVKRL